MENGACVIGPSRKLVRKIVRVLKEAERSDTECFVPEIALALGLPEGGGPEAVGQVPNLKKELDRVLSAPEHAQLRELAREALPGYLYHALRIGLSSGPHPPGFSYTPLGIGRFLTARAIRIRKEQENRAPRVLDLGCGCGAFLHWALEFLSTEFPGEKFHLAGVDADGEAVRIAERSLKVAVSRMSLWNAEIEIAHLDLLLDDHELLRRKYDLIVGNPPWMSLKGRFRGSGYSENQKREIVIRHELHTYRPNLVEAFLRKALELAEEGGVVAMVLPDRVAENLQFHSLREKMLRETVLLEMRYGFPIPGVVSDNMLLVLRKEPPGALSSSLLIETDPLSSREIERTVPQHEILKDTRLSLRPGNRFGIEKTVPLGRMVNTSVGFIAVSGSIRSERVSEDIEIVRGRDIVRYRRRGGAYMDWKPENLAGGTQDPRKLSVTPRILVRKTGTEIIAAYDESRDFPEQSLYFLYSPREDVNLKVLVAWLNSNLLQRITGNRHLTNRGTMAQIKKVDLEEIPVPQGFLNAPEEWRKRIGELVDRCSTEGPSPEVLLHIEEMLEERLAD